MNEEKILKLKGKMNSQVERIKKILNNSVNGFFNKDMELLQTVIGKQEKKINKKEIKIDELCTSIIALHQPEAKDLRIILMISRMNSDLERLADHCVNLAESAEFLLNNNDDTPFLEEIKSISDDTLKMVENSLTAFDNEDSELALGVCESDTAIDRLNEDVFQKVMRYIPDNKDKVESAMHVLRISNNLERIADLATNIAEETIYVANGEEIRHNRYSQLFEDESEG